MKKIYVLSQIDRDGYPHEYPIAVFDSEKKLFAGIKRWEKQINADQGNKLKIDKVELTEGNDYNINDFYLNKLY